MDETEPACLVQPFSARLAIQQADPMPGAARL